jgi:transcriptional regulator with XRE-family HTH domain
MDHLTFMSSITGSQIRSARAALGWSIDVLAQASSVSMSTIKRMEANGGAPVSTVANLNAIKSALEAAGIEFIGTPDDRPGIRIGRPAATQK